MINNLLKAAKTPAGVVGIVPRTMCITAASIVRVVPIHAPRNACYIAHALLSDWSDLGFSEKEKMRSMRSGSSSQIQGFLLDIKLKTEDHGS